MPKTSGLDTIRELFDPASFDVSRSPVDPPQVSLADQIRQIAARLRDINDYDRQRLRDIAAAVARCEEQLRQR